MVIADLGIVHKPPSQRLLAGPRSKQFPIRPCNRAHDRGQRRSHILRKMPAVRPRIADQLVPFIKRLRKIQRLLRAEPEQPVRVPLQFREIVKRRRPHPLSLQLHRFDRRPTRTRPRHNQRGLDPVRRKPRRFLDVFQIPDPCPAIRLRFRLS